MEMAHGVGNDTIGATGSGFAQFDKAGWYHDCGIIPQVTSAQMKQFLTRQLLQHYTCINLAINLPKVMAIEGESEASKGNGVLIGRNLAQARFDLLIRDGAGDS